MRPVARLGELFDPLDHRAIVAEDPDGSLIGVLTYRLAGPEMEVSTLYAARRWSGIGSALIARVREAARTAGCRRLWLITTNDNVDALRFYQRRGFRLARLHPGAVDRSRATLKPGISRIGEHGIPIRDELELELLELDGPAADGP